ncbi:hypothetical protein BDZ94DRAFT_871102 [Collybia nuda]|uniref:Uncharacterized protein n=1 Tax=Collybia nuda TaxID=64659 RepID=A0A9P5Y1U2_9AGAR|nr:hypothetical protein BDZ94DRAFT_871102 [Collybia nuda]
MATAAPRPPPSSRRPMSASPTPPSSSITRGATARSAASPRVPSSLNSVAVNRRPSSKAPQLLNGETRESLSASLKQETDQKEQLLVQIQNKDQTIFDLTSENNNLTSALNSAEIRINELYAEQSRSEVELAQRIDISEKLRTQVRELEKEKRDVQRRYNEQMATFEAERQAFYDNEQHLKSRIQSLTQARKHPEPSSVSAESELEDEDEDELIEANSPQQTISISRQDISDSEAEPAEMTSLKLELSTLSTSYSSLQSTLVLLQTQLMDLKRVNHELQEENESYMILLREKTLSGQFDLMRQVGGGSSEENDEGDDNGDSTENTDVGSLRSVGRSTLDRVEEELLEDSLEQELRQGPESRDTNSPTSHPISKSNRKRTISASSAPRGESLADLPITGPGLDLAAELGRAENKDILSGNTIDDRDRSPLNFKGRRSKKGSDGRKVSLPEMHGLEPSGSVNDIDALRTEVKSLKDANKALSLYASKIIDRIISQEGFEHVLAVDYDKQQTPVSTASPQKPVSNSHPKPRPQSVVVGRSSSSPMPVIDNRSSPPLPAASKLGQPNPKAQRRSLSFDWKGFSLFNPTEKKPDPNLRQLTLRPGTSPVTGARKLDTQEDEDDRRERERLNATMKLMGIQPQQQAQNFVFPVVPVQKSSSTGTPPSSNNRRFSFFGATKNEYTDVSSDRSALSTDPHTMGQGTRSNLTQEALEHAEAHSSLAALDAHERSLSAEIAKGGSSGFTEISPRSMGGRRSRRSVGGSGSTVWSAGMSGAGDDD